MPRATQPVAPAVEFKIVPCKYAFDTTDPYCATCNGMELVGEQGELLPATSCGAYSPSDVDPVEVAQQVEPEPVEPAPVQPAPAPAAPVQQPAPAPAAPAVKTTTSSAVPEKLTKKAEPVTPAKNLKIEQIPAMSQSDGLPLTGEGVTSMSAESGVSVEIKDKFGNSRWYKFAYTETRTVDPTRSIDDQRQDLWDTVNNVVDDQVDATVKAVLGE